MPRTPDRAHHALALHEVVLLLESDTQRGLSDAEAADRRERFGANVLPAATSGGLLRRLLRQFQNPLVYVLVGAGVVTSLLAEYVDSVVIFGVVIVNAVVGFLQESKAEAALDALRSMVRTETRVVRDGQPRPVPSEEVVPGDLVLVEAGDKVPADLRLARADEVRVDESTLTGESQPVRKDEVVVPDETPVADRRNVLYSGTLVTGGSAAGLVMATGAETELGRIHRLVGSAQVLDTPLTTKLARFSRLLTVVILVLAGVTFGIGILRGESGGEMFTAAVALAVGAIPEGLPAAVTITLAIGVGRMARRQAVIRRLPAVETLGSTTVICTDKTGTLTENQMTVRTLWTVAGRHEVTGSGYQPAGEIQGPDGEAARVEDDGALRWSLLAGVGCNDARLAERDEGYVVLGDPTEGAMLVVAAKGGLRAAAVADELPRVASIPFTSERQFMATLHDTRDDGRVVLVKGAVERLVEWSVAALDAQGQTVPLDRDEVLAAAGALAGEGLRVLATAQARVDGDAVLAEQELPGSLVFTGLHAMLDPPRAAVADAIAASQRAGISVKMITGDHQTTASAIAGRLGLLDVEPRPGEVLSGKDLARLSPDDRPAAVERAAVFARVSPEQKLRLVEALQADGQVVAMTGDGVNDAPALRQADIGVAMGRSGTEVAKEASDIILTDDDFTTIEAAVEEGRGVFANLTKFIIWTLPTNTAEGMLVLVAILLGTALPILPSQILWINMTSAVLLGLTLAFEPKEDGIMSRPPRDPAQPLLTSALVVRILLVSALVVAGAWWVFEWELGGGAELAQARTAAVNLVVTVQIFYLFSCRSLRHSAWRLGLFTNRWLIGGVLLQVLGQVALTYLPVMNTLFRTAPIGPGTWGRILGVALVAGAVVALDKRFGWFGRRLG
ncbi:cation-translocating P-type ATPase [Salinispora tropica]|uniref:ATPase, P-type (Transporting), HAD superfamily, subfamily IC n=1 Tax=Salinispora tropica (strain ATCC BAA-916 / DSM 44818 / JCM 13857 / NBRC 105044 / CNB-440) TaxID=369723 RepID=A4X482_SALTO|nr:HAD-IC family P-type ATPase [Salinispora tropica]ABP53682.1 ATPase, P-type (transporting), HAD superfamily, subfamily IC [Salinispora tropica CNB-440]